MQDKYKRLKFNLFENAVLVGEYGFPKTKAVDIVPEKLVSFNYLKSKGANDFIHFFIDDYQFERVWKNPDSYINTFRNIKGIIGTDFSCYTDIPEAIQIYNIFKNRCLDYYFQSNGVNVIPVACWGAENTYEWCFDGIPQNSTVAISTNGTKRGFAQYYFRKGFDIMLEILKPKNIIVYGDLPKDFPLLPNIYQFSNSQIDKFRGM